MKRGDLYVCDLNPTQGHEQSGKRPVLVMSEDTYNNGPAGLVVVVPLTTKKKPYPNRIDCPRTAENGLSVDSQILADQVRSVSIGRIGKRIGGCEQDVFRKVVDDLTIILGIT